MAETGHHTGQAATHEDALRIATVPTAVGEQLDFKASMTISYDMSGTMRTVDPETGALELNTSIDGILKAVPKMSWDVAATWSRLAIFSMRLFIDRASYDKGGIARAYADKVFPQGVDLIAAVEFWRKRIRQDSQSFAIFEGGFDASGPVALTDAPQLVIDGATGEVEADSYVTIQRKRERHFKRRSLDAKWASKGASQDLLFKIRCADVDILDHKAKGHEYAKETGWVPATLKKSPRALRAPPKWERRPKEADGQLALPQIAGETSQEPEKLKLDRSGLRMRQIFQGLDGKV